MDAGLVETAITAPASEASKLCFDFIGRQISYVFNHQIYIKKLNGKLLRVDAHVKTAEAQGEEIFDDVKKWLDDAHKLTGGVNNITDEEKEDKKCCFMGLCPELKKRYMLSKKADKALTEVLDLTSVSFNLPCQGKSSIILTGYENLESRRQKEEEIIEALMDPDLNIIGVYGMPGVGKTALVKKVALQVKKDGIFDEVIMAEVGWTVDYEKIREKIAFDLGLTALGLKTDLEISDTIRRRLATKRVLVILDNIWGPLELEKVGIFVEDFENGSAHQKEEQEGKLNSVTVANFVGDNMDVSDHQREERERINDNRGGGLAEYIFGQCEEGSYHKKEREGKNDNQRVVNDNQRRRKILLTSRNIDVLSRQMGTKKDISVRPLTDREALTLFGKIAQLNLANPSDNPGYDSDTKSVADKIVEKCAGLPLAIRTVATSLKGKKIEKWNAELKELDRCNLGDPSDADSMHSIIKWSYDLLKVSKAKSIFQLFGLFNAGCRIHIDDLLSYGMLFDFFGDYTLKEARNNLYALILDLKAANLLEEDDMSQRFGMNDIIHSFAASTASTELMFNLQRAPSLKENLENPKYNNSTAISIPFGDISELPERLICPKLKLFLLFAKDSSLKIPDAFLEQMKELKVLNMSFIHFPSLPSSLHYLAELQTLYLEYCQVEDISRIGELTKLKILSCRGSDIELLPEEIGRLTRLRLLNLGDCSELEIIAPTVLSNLSQLEELYMGDSHVKWEVEGLNDQGRRNASLAEFKQLSSMTTLMIHIQDPQCIPHDLFSRQEKLERFRIVIGDEGSWSEKYESKRMLKLKLNNNIHLRDGIRMLLKKTEDLFLDELSGVRDYVNELDGEGFTKLKHLHVQNGPELLFIVNSMGQVSFPKLESLFLHNLVKLKKICQGQLTLGSFSNLKLLEVDNCCSLRYIFSSTVVLGLKLLKKMTIRNCDMLEEIITKEGEDDAADIGKILFHGLDTIILESLPKLRCFYSGNVILEFCCLKSIAIRNCPKMKRFVSNDMEDRCLPGAPLLCPKVLLPELGSLIVDHCDSLAYMFSSSVAKSLSQLKILAISFCELMTFVVSDEERISNMPLFPKLHLLDLRCLPKLRSFCYFTGDLFELCSLSCIQICKCPNMVTFISNSLCTNIATIEECDEMNSGEIQVDIEPFFDEKVRIPSLEKLKISSMPYLRKIWQNQPRLESCNKLQDLTVEKCDKLLNLFPSNVLGRLETLDALTVRDCESLEEIIFEPQALSGRKMPTKLIAGKLRELNLFCLPKLKHVWNMESEIILAFQSLVSINVSYCCSLRSLFPASVAGSLINLEVLEIFSCEVKEIVAKEEVVARVHVPTFEFPQLTSLSLSSLPNLTNFYPGIHISRWPKLKELIITDCDNVNILASELMSLQDGESQHELPIQPLFVVDKLTAAFSDLEELKLLQLPKLFHILKKLSQPSRVFRNLRTLQVTRCESLEILLPCMVQLQTLTTLKVVECHKMINLMTLSTAESLEQLTSLGISYCQKLKEIMASKEDGDQKDQPSKVFPNLRNLQVSRCESLEILLPCMVQLQTLTTLRVVECHKMINLMTLSTAESLEQLTSLDISYCQKLKEIIAHKGDGDQKNQPSKVFPNLRNLQVSRCGSLEILLPCMVQLQTLMTLKVVECGSLEILLPCMVQLQTLTTLKVVKCHKMINLMTLSTAESLEQLTSLDISYCQKLKEIIAHKEDGDRTDQPSKVFPNLRNLQVSICDDLEILLPRMVQLQTLTTLKVVKCDKLINLMTFSTAESLEQLTSLDISYCRKLKEIIAHKKDGDQNDQLSEVFPNLRNLLVSECVDLEILLPPEVMTRTAWKVEQCDKLIKKDEHILPHDKRPTWKKFLEIIASFAPGKLSDIIFKTTLDIITDILKVL